MTKILVVDDEADLETLIVQKFRKKINEKEYIFLFAENGIEALKKIEEHADIAVVLSDINMPKMDGLTLLGELVEKAPLTKTIMISAYGDMKNIRTAMNRGAFDFLTKPVDFQDLQMTVEKTIRQVHQLKKNIEALKENNILKLYVDANVLQFMLTKDFETALTASETIEATVAFIDICNFTAISEKESPDVVVNLLNHYFELMVKEILAQNGQIDKFMGDAVMAVFKGENHLENAATACLAIRKAIHSIKNQANFDVKVSIGINSGEMVSGNVGSATLKRLDYTVIGDVVNVAARLQSLAGSNQILFPQELYPMLSKSFQTQKVGSFAVKNKTQKIDCHEVLD